MPLNWNEDIKFSAQFAKLSRAIAAVRRMDGDERSAREHEAKARKYESFLRDCATEIELGFAHTIH